MDEILEAMIDAASTRGSFARERRTTHTPTTEPARVGDYPLLWLLSLRALVVARDLGWAEPHVTRDDNETTFEWWHGDRKISAYIVGCRAEVLKVWGPDMDDEMETLVDPDVEHLLRAWAWLRG